MQIYKEKWRGATREDLESKASSINKEILKTKPSPNVDAM